MRGVTWAVLAWTVLWTVLVGIWALDPDPTPSGSAAVTGPQVPVTVKLPDLVLVFAWLFGFLVFGAIWLVARLWTARPRRSSGQDS